MESELKFRVYVAVNFLVVAVLSTSASTSLPEPNTTAIVVGGESVMEGDAIMLSCAVYNVSGERARSFRMEWRRDGVVLTRGTRVISPDRRLSVTIMDGVADRRDFVLHIDRVNRTDAGRYVCWVAVRDWYPSMPTKRSSSSVDLVVRYFPPPPLCYHDGPSNVFPVGRNVRMICAVDKGEPTVRTRWKGPDGIVLFGHETKIEGLITNTLAFQASLSHNEMEFTCKVTSNGFPGQSSSCTIGPIQVIEADHLDEIYSSSSYTENSVDIRESEAFPEPDIISTTRRYPSITPFNNSKAHGVIDGTVPPPTPKVGSSEDGIQIISKTNNTTLALCITIFLILLAISSVINVILYYKLNKRKGCSEDDDNGIISTITRGVSNEEYMDMQGRAGQSPTEGEFYSSIRCETLDNDSVLVQYDRPRSTVIGATASSHRRSGSDTAGIYENMGARPKTPPRIKRKKGPNLQEHAV